VVYHLLATGNLPPDVSFQRASAERFSKLGVQPRTLCCFRYLTWYDAKYSDAPIACQTLFCIFVKEGVSALFVCRFLFGQSSFSIQLILFKESVRA